MAQIVATDACSVEANSATIPTWQEAMKRAIRRFDHLEKALELPPSSLTCDGSILEQFPLLIPLEMTNRMQKGDPHDPLLRQFLPVQAELAEVAGYRMDPVGDLDSQSTPGMLHKYHGRALLITTGACAVHCRYCFRRHFPYSDMPHSIEQWQPALDKIAADPTIHEVLLSGGDPLMIVDRQLSQLVDRLADIPHIQRLRIHTRMPVLIPQRVCDELLHWVTQTRLSMWMVLHINHPREIDAATVAAIERLQMAGVMILNQAVLMRGINDQADTLVELCERLVNLKVLPYYLSQLDRVQGAAHFEVSVEKGKKLMAELQSRLPGYAVPRYVQELAGEPFKVPL